MYTKEKFIEKANKIYNNKYDYILVNFIDMQTKVEIICPIHGKFEKEPTYHINKNQGCPKCGNLKSAKTKKMPLKEYIEKVNKIHNNFYDYSLVKFENIHEQIKIICPIHGIVEMKASNHLHNKSKCKYCINNNLKSNTEDFIKKSKEIYGDKYDYSLVEYVDNKTDIKLIYDGKIFEQNPKSHLNGHFVGGMCLSDFIKNANNILKFNYDYKFVNFEKICDKIKIICKKHGVFEQRVSNHLKGTLCPKCRIEKNKKISFEKIH